MRLVTSDMHEAIAAVSDVYCAHDVKILESNHGINAVLDASGDSRQRVVTLRYSAPVQIDAGRFENLLLFMTALDAAATAAQSGDRASWSVGRTLPLSPDLPSLLQFDRRFCQQSVRLDKHYVEDLCARLADRPLDRPIRFALTPFTPTLEQTWQQGLRTIRSLQVQGLVIGTRTMQRFEEFLATLVLETHPHNFSDLLNRNTHCAAPRMVREAERMMRTGGPDLLIGDIAKALRVSPRSLELGFRETRKMTPTQAYRRIRLGQAREELLHPDRTTTVTSVATLTGFFHLARFSSYYHSEFHELPSETIRRNRKSV